VGGATGIVRAGAAIARGAQSGYLRAYAMLLLAGMAALALYFLLQST
jgi:NADH-quinone oxidoreductase subunit L